MIPNSTLTLTRLHQYMGCLADPAYAQTLIRFFRTGVGDYGEGDRFFGITIPHLRAIARRYDCLTFDDMHDLLASPYHEDRMVALIMLVDKSKRGNAIGCLTVYRFYMDHIDRINNWDLVDVSAPTIVGRALMTRSRRPLYHLARSPSLWKRRIAIVATYAFIHEHDYGDTLAIARVLLHDEHHLIHKAVGWMLREVGKSSPQTLRSFLDEHAAFMPRTMLRYAIERMSESERRRYRNKKSRCKR